MTCRGTKDGTAVMMIQINITSEERQFVLNLRRIKSCRKGSCDIFCGLFSQGRCGHGIMVDRAGPSGVVWIRGLGGVIVLHS